MLLNLPSELIQCITTYLTHREYVQLWHTSSRLRQLLNSDTFLCSRAQQESLAVNDYRRGLIYLAQHKIINYDQDIKVKDTYFRWYDENVAIDIFDRPFFTDGGRLEQGCEELLALQREYNFRIKTIAYHETPMRDKLGWFPYHGYLILTQDGRIISHALAYEIPEEDDNHETTIVLYVQAVDLYITGIYFTYRNLDNEYFLSDVHDAWLLRVKPKSVREIEATPSYCGVDIDHYLDADGNLYYQRWDTENKITLFASSIRQLSYSSSYIYYLQEDGFLFRIKDWKDDHREMLGVNICLFTHRDKEIYMVTFTNELHCYRSGKSMFIAVLPACPLRLQTSDDGDVLIEYK